MPTRGQGTPIKLAKLYRELGTARAVAEKLGLNAQAVYRSLKDHGVKMGKRGGRRGRTYQAKWGIRVSAEVAAQYVMKAQKSIPPSERYISPNDAGRILSVTGEAVKQWIFHGRLPAVKLSNGYWAIKVADLIRPATIHTAQYRTISRHST